MQMASKIAFSLALSCKIRQFFFSAINIHAQVELLQGIWEMNDEPISDCPMLQGKVAFANKSNQVVVNSPNKQFDKKSPLQKCIVKNILSQQSTAQWHWCFFNAEMCFETGSSLNRIQHIKDVKKWQSLRGKGAQPQTVDLHYHWNGTINRCRVRPIQRQGEMWFVPKKLPTIVCLNEPLNLFCKVNIITVFWLKESAPHRGASQWYPIKCWKDLQNLQYEEKSLHIWVNKKTLLLTFQMSHIRPKSLVYIYQYLVTYFSFYIYIYIS